MSYLVCYGRPPASGLQTTSDLYLPVAGASIWHQATELSCLLFVVAPSGNVIALLVISLITSPQRLFLVLLSLNLQRISKTCDINIIKDFFTSFLRYCI